VKVLKAEALGFCFGVRRAIEMARAAAESAPVYTLGSVVHNAAVVDALALEGARPVARLDEVPNRSTVVITAHGAGPAAYDAIRRRGLVLVDATCPIVRRTQERAAVFAGRGFRVLVYGDERHPEVRGILEWTKGQGIASLSSAIRPEVGEKGLALLSQTTMRRGDFEAFAQKIVGRHHDGTLEFRVVDTTCPETTRRYEAARDLAGRVEVMVVVGSPASANTSRLVEVSREAGLPTHAVERASDLIFRSFEKIARCGVTAGTSTPADEIDEVVARLSSFGTAELPS
jgi:4-hydroxy-3-methylbut-2-enyl diphosphate reductase